MKVPFFDLNRQYKELQPQIDAAVRRVFHKGMFIGGEEVEKFEENFSKLTKTSYCISCGNGTDALELALRALGVGPEDEVIVPAFTYVSDAEVVSLVGAKVVLVDVLAHEYTLDPSKLQAAINVNTKAIIVTHLYGLPCHIDSIMAIARQNNLKLIEDCAQAHGATLEGRPVGSLGDIAAFSFYPTKNLGAYGDGGAVVTNDKKLAEKVRLLANHGQLRKNEHVIEGRNSRMDVLQAAVLNVKMEYLKQWNENRRKTAAAYNEQLIRTDLILPHEYPGAWHVYHLYVVRSEKRDQLRHYLSEQGIATEIHYPQAIHQLLAFAHLNVNDDHFPVASGLAATVLSLPVFPELKEEEVGFVIEAMNKFGN